MYYVLSRLSTYSGMNNSPQNTKIIKTNIWNIDCPRICFIMFLDTMWSLLLFGYLYSNYSVGASVARARDAKVSIIKFIHNIWIGAKTCCFIRLAPMRVVPTATMLIVNWNCINFLIESNMFLPQRTALTIELKLSSSRIMAAASLATYVPAIPMAKPTSAFFRAGASLVPSPVAATTSPLSFSPVTRAYLSSGLDLAKTSKLSLILLNYSSFYMVSTLRGFP